MLLSTNPMRFGWELGYMGGACPLKGSSVLCNANVPKVCADEYDFESCLPFLNATVNCARLGFSIT